MFISSFFKRLWWNLPLSRQNKEWVKTSVFSALPFLFKKNRVYRGWKDARIFSDLPEKRLNQPNPFQMNGSGYRSEPVSKEPITTLAIVIHAFYFDIFLEIMDYLIHNSESKYRIYITSPETLSEKIARFFNDIGCEYSFLAVENRGRDILPFLEVLPQVFDDGYQAVLKIHTKKTDHTKSGDLWRKDLYKKLLGEKAMQRALEIFNGDGAVGMIGAPGHTVPLNLYYGANAKTVAFMSEAMGVTPSQLSNLNFSAGSMFYVRKQALLPLLNLGLKSKDFEDESGQKDGTLSQAVERAFTISAVASNMKLVDTSYHPQKQNQIITKDHPFTY